MDWRKKISFSFLFLLKEEDVVGMPFHNGMFGSNWQIYVTESRILLGYILIKICQNIVLRSRLM